MRQKRAPTAGKLFASFLLLLPATIAVEPIVLDLQYDLDAASPFTSHRTSLIKRQQLIDTYVSYVPTHSEFYVNMAVGSPAQQIKFAVTVLEDTWLPGPLPSEDYCSGEPTTVPQYNICYQVGNSGTFDPSKSKTYKNETSIRNFNSSVPYAYGYYGVDNWTLGQTNINNVTFGVATNFSYSPPLGLGVYPSFGAKRVESLPQTLKREGLVDLVAYGVYLNDWRSNTGQLSIGSVDISKYDGDLHTFSAQLLNTLVPLQGLNLVAGKKSTTLAAKKTYTATVQLGNSGLYLPDNVITSLATKYNSKYDSAWGGYLCKCSEGDTDDKLEWTFDGITITSPIDQLVLPALAKNGTRWKLPNSDEDACELRMASSTPFAPIEFGLGTPFLRAAYVVFDFSNNQTSIAQAKINVTTQSLVPLNESLMTFDPKGDASNVPTISIPGLPSASPTAGKDGNGDGGGGGGDGKSSSNTGAIVGGVVGGIGGIALIVGAVLLFLHKRKKRPEADGGQQYQPVPPPAAVAAAGNEDKQFYQPPPPRPVSELASPMSPPPPVSPPPPDQYGQQQWGNQPQHQQYPHQGYPSVPQPQQAQQYNPAVPQPQQAQQYRPPVEMPS